MFARVERTFAEIIRMFPKLSDLVLNTVDFVPHLAKFQISDRNRPIFTAFCPGSTTVDPHSTTLGLSSAEFGRKSAKSDQH